MPADGVTIKNYNFYFIKLKITPHSLATKYTKDINDITLSCLKLHNRNQRQHIVMQKYI